METFIQDISIRYEADSDGSGHRACGRARGNQTDEEPALRSGSRGSDYIRSRNGFAGRCGSACLFDTGSPGDKGRSDGGVEVRMNRFTVHGSEFRVQNLLFTELLEWEIRNEPSRTNPEP